MDLHMVVVVSQNEGTQIDTPKYWGKAPLVFRNTHVQLDTESLDSFAMQPDEPRFLGFRV